MCGPFLMNKQISDDVGNDEEFGDPAVDLGIVFNMTSSKK